jgi:2'-5' RNA ligase
VSEERARLFAALELPDEVREALAAWRSKATAEIAGLRPLPDDHLHVTLCFLGWQAESEIPAVIQACAAGVIQAGAAGAIQAPPTLSLGAALWLPPRRPRVLAVRLDDDHGRVAMLQGELSGLLRDGGWYEPEDRPYLPHVTVARAGRRDRVSSAPLPPPPPLFFTASRLTLFRSRLSRQGARYEALWGASLVSTA